VTKFAAAVLFALIGATSIDWFIFHPVKGGYDASWPGYVDIGGPDGRIAHGCKLFDSANTMPKSFVPVEGAGHNDLPT